jgi:hypothetical protein
MFDDMNSTDARAILAQIEQCQSMSASPVTFLVLNLRAYYYRVDQSKERTKYMCVTAEECSCSHHI